VGNILCALGQVYLIAIFGRIILSWFPVSAGSAMAKVFEVLYTITEPVLGPIRRVLPPVGIGGMGLDLSPIIVILLIQFFWFNLVC
jgi:YggT family protein